ncbi:hypothetical protein V6Z11_D06G098700 [Gossypium hirsutum]
MVGPKATHILGLIAWEYGYLIGEVLSLLVSHVEENKVNRYTNLNKHHSTINYKCL